MIKFGNNDSDKNKNVSKVNMSDIVKFYKSIHIKTASGSMLPFICETNEENRAWNVPQHPTDKNTKFSDTVWTEPKSMSFTGYVSIPKWEEFKQLIEGNSSSINDKGKKIAGIVGDKFKLSNGLTDKVTGSTGLGLYEITCLGGIYKNMALTGLTRSEGAEINSAFKVTLNFQEALQVEAKSMNLASGKVENPCDSTTLSSGEQNVIKSSKDAAKKNKDKKDKNKNRGK